MYIGYVINDVVHMQNDEQMNVIVNTLFEIIVEYVENNMD